MVPNIDEAYLIAITVTNRVACTGNQQRALRLVSQLSSYASTLSVEILLLVCHREVHAFDRIIDRRNLPQLVEMLDHLYLSMVA